MAKPLAAKRQQSKNKVRKSTKTKTFILQVDLQEKSGHKKCTTTALQLCYLPESATQRSSPNLRPWARARRRAPELYFPVKVPALHWLGLKKLLTQNVVRDDFYTSPQLVSVLMVGFAWE